MPKLSWIWRSDRENREFERKWPFRSRSQDRKELFGIVRSPVQRQNNVIPEEELVLQ
ncbi:MAG: hypothetical protein EBE86_013360 [Hormoscilla sp. GUM202]|nr:hypothetical protein [Hormoscilla sp. GUM202]